MAEQHPKRILIVGPSWVGDMVMAQTLFTKLKEIDPLAVIDVLAPDWSRPLLERMPEVNQAISMPIGHGQLLLAARKKIGQQLKSGNYDVAYVLPNSFKSALIPWFAKIPKRIGWRGELRFLVLNDIRVLDKEQYPLMIERFMALALPNDQLLTQPYPRPKLRVSPETVNAAKEKFGLMAATSILALCPGAEFGPAKRWPENYYAEIANAWLAKGGQVCLFGSKNDFAVCEDINKATNGQCTNLAGKTSLAEAIDLLSEAEAVVSNDSGLMHIAAALDRPLVAIYGSSDPRFTPPLSDKVQIVRLGLSCSPCFKRECPLTHLNCLKQLPPERVQTALEEVLYSKQSDLRLGAVDVEATPGDCPSSGLHGGRPLQQSTATTQKIEV
ncbi:MAG: lipopolysaccharide heptosyltransferase II [Gammaproteobacteria bacterium]|nr:lipopolysaccharide heptosyltransferase II [Gammaproteobacteria bacterium]